VIYEVLELRGRLKKHTVETVEFSRRQKGRDVMEWKVMGMVLETEGDCQGMIRRSWSLSEGFCPKWFSL
jgi:hypothetical protein